MPEGRPILDTSRLSTWLDAEGLAVGQPLEVTPLAGGKSNVMFRLRRGDHRWVLRRPPGVAVSGAERGMEREFRILSALTGTGVPRPDPIALCRDATVLGAVGYLMADVAGRSPMPEPLEHDHATVAAAAEAMVDALVALHEVDWVRVGLTDFGNPHNFHERQVGRWVGQLESYQARELPGLSAVAAWLPAQAPPQFRPTIMHGDYHMMNVLVSPKSQRSPVDVRAILDWETSTIGDPLLDLMGLVEVWRTVYPEAEGWPSADEIVGRYAAARDIDDERLDYYAVLYNFRLAVLLEGIHQRALRDSSRIPDPKVAGLAERAAARAQELLP